ncbi:MAG TPA: hypothetical protein VKE51_14770 [Vicinamibacterales bacterium]|nr:hypothetical protein [Vicinamibacterales bacterium]
MDPRNYNVPGAISVNVVFVALLVLGVVLRSLRLRSVVLLVLLWVAGYAGLSYVSFITTVYTPFLFVTYVAALDLLALGVMFRDLDKFE